MQRARLLDLAADYADTNWTDPATPPPANARRFRITRPDATFSVRGRVSTAPDAAVKDLAGMTIDAYVATEQPDGGGWARGKSVAEVEGGPLDSEIMLVASDLVRGREAAINVTLVGVPAPVVIEILLLDGGRLL